MIENWQFHRFFAGIALVISITGAGWGGAPEKPDCNKCPSILQDLEVLKKKSQIATADLQSEQAAVKALADDQSTKKRQLTSRLFVFAARAETAQNLQAHQQKAWVFNCSKCKSK